MEGKLAQAAGERTKAPQGALILVSCLLLANDGQRQHFEVALILLLIELGPHAQAVRAAVTISRHSDSLNSIGLLWKAWGACRWHGEFGSEL